MKSSARAAHCSPGVSRERKTAEARRAYLAKLELLGIWVQIARHDAAAADRQIERFEAAIAQVASYPRLGRSVENLGPGLRSIPVGSYLIFYRPDDEGVLVVRIIHGARRIVPELFE